MKSTNAESDIHVSPLQTVHASLPLTVIRADLPPIVVRAGLQTEHALCIS